MKKMLLDRYLLQISFFALALLCYSRATASHIVGGELTYQYLGDTSFANDSTTSKYRVNLTIYEDCLNGSPVAIEQDDPAFLSIWDNDRNADDRPFLLDTTLYYTSSVQVPTNFSNLCVTNIPPTCLTKKTFSRVYYLPHNGTGYVISYQRCCRNASIDNINNPGNTGSTFYATIPAWPVTNNSAVFTNYPPQIICLDNPLFYDNSATDADRDSLSYEFCVSLECCLTDPNAKPYPLRPDQFPPLYYDSISYLSGFSSSDPLPGYPPMQINPSTGLITGTPNRIGRYLVTLCCNEWRHGVIINTSKREFQFVVTSCTKKVVANIPQYSTDFNTYIVDCKDFTVDFANISSGGFAWLWNFGLPNTSGDTSTAFQPMFTYPDTGTFSVKLVVNPGSTCPDSITRFVKIYPKFLTNFDDSGTQCPGDSIRFKDMSSSTLKPITYWKWIFGDGDSSFLENPVHSYAYGGTYNVILISENVRDCMDTALKQIPIEVFKPFAGNDTIIVKGQSVAFDATGGVQYLWFPSDNLSDSAVFDPIGYFPDTGIFNYSVEVKSEFGCIGFDTVKVTVVNQAEFFVPTAFTPNGDGRNDIFQPIAIGYKQIKYFRVFNRWGQKVYNSDSFEAGWDGTFNGEKVDMGVYFWEIGFVDRFGNEGALKGDVTLIR